MERQDGREQRGDCCLERSLDHAWLKRDRWRRPHRAGLSDAELQGLDAYWRAANYLSVGQIYLLRNPLLREPLTLEHVKRRLLGHWGTTPGLNFIYVHLNRAIRARDLDMIYVIGPGHGGPAIVANSWLEGSYSEFYPNVLQDEEGMERLFRQFSFPGGVPSHVAPETPGSIHEGGELGYSLSHAFGAAFDNPGLVVACVVGYEIANPALLARLPQGELESLLVGYGYTPYFVEGNEPAPMHQRMAATLDAALDEIGRIQREARQGGIRERAQWPLIVLNTPKGWTGPKEVDGLKTEGSWRSHQVPLSAPASRPEHLAELERWLRSHRPAELFDERGAPRPELARLAPAGERRMGANPHANGGVLLRDLKLPDFRDYAFDVDGPGRELGEATRILGTYLRDVMSLNDAQRNFRVFGPDETASNRLNALFEVTDRTWLAAATAEDDHLSPDGRVMEILSEHACQGWLEGYLLSGRHGLFSCYEAFIHIVDSMFNQHAKWLKVTSKEIAWRRPIASLNILLTSQRLAPGPQRLQLPGPGLHRPRDEQEGGRDPRLPAAGREHAALRHGSGPALAQPGQCRRRGQAAGAAVARNGCGDQALHGRHRHLRVGEQRRG